MSYLILFFGLFLIFFPFWTNYKVGKIYKNLSFWRLSLFMIFIGIMIIISSVGVTVTLKELDLSLEKNITIVMYSMLAAIHLLFAWDL
jgi:magnesium-transporting ATPase (P-type)